MYITNKPKVASIAENAGVDTIFVDMEYIGKQDRQGGQDTVQNHHTCEDIKKVKKVLSKSKVMVRINPIHDATLDYCSSEEEINRAIDAGADIIMLPYFKTQKEVEKFLEYVNKRVKNLLLFETSNAAESAADIIKISDIDQIHIGLNDLSLCYGMKFMFELMENGMVEDLCKVINKAGIKYGIGGIASLGQGALPAEYIIREHYRLGSSAAILSRSFCNTDNIKDLCQVEKRFNNGVKEIRALEKECKDADYQYFIDNKKQLDAKIRAIKESLSK